MYYGIIPSHVLNHPELTDSEKLFFTWLTANLNEDGCIYLTYDEISAKYNTPARTLRRYVLNMKRHGLVKTVKTEFGKPCKIYPILDAFTIRPKLATLDGQNWPHWTAKIGHIGEKKTSTPINNINKYNISIKKSKTDLEKQKKNKEIQDNVLLLKENVEETPISAAPPLSNEKESIEVRILANWDEFLSYGEKFNILMKNNAITRDILTQGIEEFKKHILSTEINSKSVSELHRHFGNWLRGWVRNNKAGKNTNRVNPGVQDYEF